MPEKTKKNKDSLSSDKEKSDVNCENAEKSSWSEDRKNHSYYYDDASGYEIYLPEDDDEEDKSAG
jgi:hypothetical protein